MQWPILFLGTCGTYYGFLFYSCRGREVMELFHLIQKENYSKPTLLINIDSSFVPIGLQFKSINLVALKLA